VLSAHAIHVAPGGLAKSVAAAALVKGAVASGSTLTIIQGTLMAWTKAKLAVVIGASLILTTGATVLVVEETHSAKANGPSPDGLPRTLEELNAWYVEPPAGQNAASYYLQGFSALKIGDANEEPNLPVVGGLTTMLTKQPAVMAATTAFVQNNQQALQLFAQGAQYDQSRYPVDFTRDALDGLHLTHLNNIKRGTQTITVAAMLDAENQHGKQAADDVLLSFALTRSLKDEPLAISQLVRVAVVTMSLTALEQVFNRTTVPPESLSELAQTFRAMEESDAKGEAFNRSLIGERVMVMNHFKRATIADLVAAVADGTTDEQRQLFVKRLKRFGGIKAEQNYVENVFQQFLSARQEPFPDRLTNAQDVQQKVSENPNGLLLLNNAWLTGYAGLARTEAKCLANLRLAVTAVALEQFRAALSQYPSALSELTPAYLDAVPADPFDGQPLRYRKQGPGYILYSVGPDLKDDMGQRMKANIGDIVFAVTTLPSA
jgi:hypothetical protein